MPTTRRDLLKTAAGAKHYWVPAAFLQEQNVRAWSDMPVWAPSSPQMAGFARRSNKKAIAAGIKPEREREVLAAWAAKK